MKSIDELMVRVLQGCASPEESLQVRRWRDLSSANEEKWVTTAKAWHGIGQSITETPFRRRVPDPDRLIRATGGLKHGKRLSEREDRTGSAVPGEKKGGVELRRWTPLAAAAVLLLALGILSYQGLTSGPDMATSPITITTASAELATVETEEGATIRLGPNSSLQLKHHPDGSTDVWLAGRGFFAVERRDAPHFTVRTPQGKTTVLGTRFEVRAEKEFSVLVVEGEVAVDAGGTRVSLGDGQITRRVPGQPQITESVTDLEAHLSWMGNSLIFRNTPLPRVIREIEQHFGHTIHWDQATLSHHEVTASFTDEDVEDVLIVVCEIVGAECDLSDQGNIQLSRDRPEFDSQ